MYHQGGRADLSQSVAGRPGRLPVVLRSVVTRALADKPFRPNGEALARLLAHRAVAATPGGALRGPLLRPGPLQDRQRQPGAPDG